MRPLADSAARAVLRHLRRGPGTAEYLVSTYAGPPYLFASTIARILDELVDAGYARRLPDGRIAAVAAPTKGTP